MATSRLIYLLKMVDLPTINGDLPFDHTFDP